MSETNGDQKTTIPTVISTRERLKAYGKKGETWNNLIIRLLNEYDEMKAYIKEWDNKMIDDGR
jgi:hypothetical protein